MLKRIFAYTTAIFLSFTSCNAFSGDWYGGLIAGGGVSRVGQDNTLTLFTSTSPIKTDSFIVDPVYKSAGLFGITAGYRFCENYCVQPSMRPAIGISALYLTDAKVKGVLHPLVNVAPDFDTLNFTYHHKSFILMLTPQIIFQPRLNWHPFVALGLGVSWNKLSDYEESSPIGSTATPSPNFFGSHTTASFAYAPSIGIEHFLNEHTMGRIEFQYLNVGNAHFSKLVDQETNQHYKAGQRRAYLAVFSLLFY
jgi:hypothetical protein